MPRLLSVLLAFLLAISALPATAQEKPQPWPTKEWATSSPEEQGMSSERLARLVEFGGSNNMDSLLVTRHGRIVLEATYAPFQAGLKHRINSSTKAVISTLVAMAMRDGKLDSTDRKVMEFFADRTIANLDERKQAITVRHLLDMTSGLEWSEGLDGFRSFLAMERSPDWQQFILDQPMSTAPGTLFYYDSGNSHLLSAILTKVTGKSALAYARETLFGPLGIDDVMWRGDRRGSQAAAPASTCIRATWRRSAISTCAAAYGKASRSCRRRGSRACARRMSTCGNPGRRICATAASSG